jgi:hypothetical protein
VNGDVRQVQPDDPEVAEEWQRETNEPELRAVAACRVDEMGGWLVSVSVMEFVRSEPLESELRHSIGNALRGVNGAVRVEEDDHEQWFVAGTPSGRALVEAAALVVDEMANQTRAYVDRF